jgi:hypothetical protein
MTHIRSARNGSPPQSRAESYTQVKTLRDQGLNGMEIARRLGFGNTYVYDLLNDPCGEKLVARKNGYRRPCPNCGTLMDGSNGNGPNAARVCATCAPDAYRVWTREAVIQAMHDFAALVQRPPYATDWEPAMALAHGWPDVAARFWANDQWPHTATVQQLFGSWSNGLVAAGFPRKGRGERSGLLRRIRLVLEDGQPRRAIEIADLLGWDPGIVGRTMASYARRGEFERVSRGVYRKAAA